MLVCCCSYIIISTVRADEWTDADYSCIPLYGSMSLDHQWDSDTGPIYSTWHAVGNESSHPRATRERLANIRWKPETIRSCFPPCKIFVGYIYSDVYRVTRELHQNDLRINGHCFVLFYYCSCYKCDCAKFWHQWKLPSASKFTSDSRQNEIFEYTHNGIFTCLHVRRRMGFITCPRGINAR